MGEEVKKSGVRLMVVPVGRGIRDSDTCKMASKPCVDNVEKAKHWVILLKDTTRFIAGTCPVITVPKKTTGGRRKELREHHTPSGGCLVISPSSQSSVTSIASMKLDLACGAVSPRHAKLQTPRCSNIVTLPHVPFVSCSGEEPVMFNESSFS